MVRVADGRLMVEGAISMDNARSLLEAAREHLRAPRTVIDLSATTEIDSSAVALLLEWRRDAQRAGIDLQIINAPASIKSLGELYGVSHLLGVA